MIKSNKDLKIVKVLNFLYPTKDEVNLIICEGFDCIEAPDGTRAFGVFVPQTLTIYVAEDVPEKEQTLPHTIAHEFRHYLQHVFAHSFDEDDAEAFADSMQILSVFRNF